MMMMSNSTPATAGKTETASVTNPGETKTTPSTTGIRSRNRRRAGDFDKPIDFPLKRFLVFGSEQWERSHHLGDLRATYDALEEAKAHDKRESYFYNSEEPGDTFEFGEMAIFDTHTGDEYLWSQDTGWHPHPLPMFND